MKRIGKGVALVGMLAVVPFAQAADFIAQRAVPFAEDSIVAGNVKRECAIATQLPAALVPHRDELADATVVSFCTGGIRCEKAALHLQADGMDNLLQLDGGILGYFEQVGGFGYDGRCFVFDGRVALDPALEPLVDGDEAMATG